MSSRSKLVHGTLHHRFVVVATGGVERVEQTPPALPPDEVDDLRTRALEQIRHHHISAFGGEPLAARSADAVGTTGDHGHLPLQSTHGETVAVHRWRSASVSDLGRLRPSRSAFLKLIDQLSRGRAERKPAARHHRRGSPSASRDEESRAQRQDAIEIIGKAQQQGSRRSRLVLPRNPPSGPRRPSGDLHRQSPGDTPSSTLE